MSGNTINTCNNCGGFISPLQNSVHTCVIAASEPLFAVVAVDFKSGTERFLAQGQTRRSADAIVTMAVRRRGVEEEFFKFVAEPYTLNTPEHSAKE